MCTWLNPGLITHEIFITEFEQILAPVVSRFETIVVAVQRRRVLGGGTFYLLLLEETQSLWGADHYSPHCT